MEIDLRAYLRTLWKRKWYGVAVFLLIVLAGALFTARATRVYDTRTTLLVGESQVSLENVAEGLFVRNFSVGLLKSYAEILRSRSIAQKAVVNAGLNVSPGEVQHGLTASAILDTQIIDLHYRGPDPVKAQRIANAVADAFVNDIDKLGGAEVNGKPAVQVSIIDRAVTPFAPISPNKVRNMTLAVLLGLLAGVGLPFVVEQLDVSLKHKEEVEALGLAVLGSIPRLDTHHQEVYLERDMTGLAGEAFRKLRTSVGFINLETPIRSLLVTSPMSREGKTTNALNLAAAYALSGLRTILVEADLRRPSLHRVFGMNGTNGLTTAIVGDVPLTEAIMATEIRNLSVLVAGAIPPNPVELLGSDQMTDLLERLERMFDIVIVDAPPLVPVADPAALAGRCDGVIIVARAGKTDRRRLADSARVVERAGGKLLGIVLNYVRPTEAPYDYEYYSGYNAPKPAVTTERQT